MLHDTSGQSPQSLMTDLGMIFKFVPCAAALIDKKRNTSLGISMIFLFLFVRDVVVILRELLCKDISYIRYAQGLGRLRFRERFAKWELFVILQPHAGREKPSLDGEQFAF